MELSLGGLPSSPEAYIQRSEPHTHWLSFPLGVLQPAFTAAPKAGPPFTWVRVGIQVQVFGHRSASFLSDWFFPRGVLPSLTTGLLTSWLCDRGSCKKKSLHTFS